MNIYCISLLRLKERQKKKISYPPPAPNPLLLKKKKKKYSKLYRNHSNNLLLQLLPPINSSLLPQAPIPPPYHHITPIHTHHNHSHPSHIHPYHNIPPKTSWFLSLLKGHVLFFPSEIALKLANTGYHFMVEFLQKEEEKDQFGCLKFVNVKLNLWDIYSTLIFKPYTFH